MPNILLLEDDKSFGYILSEYLMMQDIQVNWVKLGEEALEVLENTLFDLAILDIMLPTIDGFEVANEIKKRHPELPFIFLSAKSLKIDQLKGFKLGANDYVTKPVDEELLVAKIKALLRNKQSRGETPENLILGEYIFFPKKQKLNYHGEIVKLTNREAELLSLFYQYKNKLLPRDKALKEIWGSKDEFSRKSMDVFISHLRKYLSKDKNIRIENIHGKGFIFHC